MQSGQEPSRQATFNDTAGREWQPRLDFLKLRVIRDQVGLDLGDVEQSGRVWAEFLSNDLKALDAIWLAIVHATGDVTKDDWLAAMDGERLDAARGALKEAILNFTRPLKRGMLETGLGAVDKAYRRAIAQAETAIHEQTEKAIERALSQPGMPPPSVLE